MSKVILADNPDASCIEDLQNLGFTDYEARVYMALLQHYPVTAYEVSKQAGLPRANVYNALESLTNKLAVQPVSENPVKYVPIDPKQMLDRIARTTSSRCHDLGEKLAALKPLETTQFVWTVMGDENIHAKIAEMIEQATRHIWVKGAHHLLESHLESLRRAAGRGVDILVILFAPPELLPLYEFGANAHVYLHEGNGIMVGMSQTLLTLTTDFKEALTANIGKDGYGAFTHSRPVVNLAESLIRHELYLAEIFKKFGPALDAAFGPALLSLRQQYLPQQQVSTLEQMLAYHPQPKES